MNKYESDSTLKAIIDESAPENMLLPSLSLIHMSEAYNMPLIYCTCHLQEHTLIYVDAATVSDIKDVNWEGNKYILIKMS